MTRISNKQAQIPQFSLYGETAHRSLIDFVHIEEIHVRSATNNWIIKPHRHNTLFQILFIRKGATSVLLDDTTHKLNSSCVITIPTGVVHGFHFQPDTEGYVLSLAINHQGLDTDNQLNTLFNEDMSQAHALKLNDDSSGTFLWDRLREIKAELDVAQRDQSLALFSLIKLVLIDIRRKVLKDDIQPLSVRQELQLSERFIQAVEENFREHRSIASYAKLLHLSASTLNRSCIKYLNMSAKKYLQERMHTEAKRLLIYTSESLVEIAFQLGFTDAAYFSRAFRNIEGCSPRDFRKNMDERRDIVSNKIM